MTADERLNRSCGTCYACCVYLGVNELKKFSGERCKHLTKTGRNPDKRCSIFNHRPEACSRFLCLWRQGILGPDQRPDKSGILLCGYPRRDDMVMDDITSTNDVAVTITIIDPKKCGTLTSGPLSDAIQDTTKTGINDIKIVYHATKSTIHFLDGKIRHGTLLSSDEPENLVMETYDPIIGTYEVHDAKEI